MKRILFLLGIVCALVLAGCGGGGDDPFTNNNQFRGSWAGTIVANSQPAENIRMTIANNGSITGSETVDADTAALTGNVDQNGRFNIISRLAGTEDVRYTGDMSFDSQGRIRGTGIGTQGNTQVNITFVMNDQGF
ncbi:MAG: hypothetical protein ACAH95_11000 [Fimbriimonas sp.]